MKNKEEKEVRKIFGEAVKKYRYSFSPKHSQKQLSNYVNSKLIQEMHMSELTTQETISKIENARQISLKPEIVIVISDICDIPKQISDKYIAIIESNKQNTKEKNQIVSISEFGQLLANPTNIEFEAYLGKYYCYFHSTNSEDPKIVEAEIVLSVDENDTQKCSAMLTIIENDKEIKKYMGQFILNRLYRMSYCILVCEDKQEVSLMVSNLFNPSINNNSINIALVLTTSAGSTKRPTMHRMIITRKKLNNSTIKSILPELKLNTDVITISETQLNKLEKEFSEKATKNVEENDLTKAMLNCIQYIRTSCPSEKYYSIDEAIIYDSKTFSESTLQRSYLVSLLREKTDNPYCNKISDTITKICLNIINNQKED